MSDIFSSFHLQRNNEKMSKSKGNGFDADELIEDLGFTSDQIRYYLSILSLTEKPSNFDLEHFKSRNEFLAGPLNAAFEKPISACLKHHGGKIPDGKLLDKTVNETKKIIQIYLKGMLRAEYAKLLFAVENYARHINSLFAQFKPHDDRYPEAERIDALYSSFYVLKNLVIMLSPFAPSTIERLRISLNLKEDIYQIDKLAESVDPGHEIGEMSEFFPAVSESEN